MGLSQRAALVTVALVGAATTAAAMLTIDQLPDESRVSMVDARSPGVEIETGALPRESLFPEQLPVDPEDSDLAEPEVSRFEFVPDGAFDLSADQWPSVVTLQSEDQNSWSTETHTARVQNSLRAAVPSSTPTRRSSAASPRRYSSLTQRLAEIGPAATKRIAARFESVKVPWPPAEIALVAIKDKKHLELHAQAPGGAWTFVHSYPVLAASGGTGPKLTRGDKQVPEGIYRISFLNPNSRYHVSMRVNYPNAFDRKMARKDGRRDLGGDIMIHGKRSSAGCLAMGDEAAEELFVLAAEIGVKNIQLVIAPTDFRDNAIPTIRADQPSWLSGLYMEVASEMSKFKAPPATAGGNLLSLLGL